MNSRYAVGRWESLWSGEPYISHRIILDLETKRVVAGQDRNYGRWTPMGLQDVAYMQQILYETFKDIYENPEDFDFAYLDNLPSWALPSPTAATSATQTT